MKVFFDTDGGPLPAPGPDACPVCRGHGLVRHLDRSIASCPTCNGTGTPSEFMRRARRQALGKFELATLAHGRPISAPRCAFCGKGMKKKLWISGFAVCSVRCGEAVGKRQEY